MSQNDIQVVHINSIDIVLKSEEEAWIDVGRLWRIDLSPSSSSLSAAEHIINRINLSRRRGTATPSGSLRLCPPEKQRKKSSTFTMTALKNERRFNVYIKKILCFL